MKFKKLFCMFVFFIPFWAFSNNTYVLNTDGLIDKRASEKLNLLGEEIYTKTGIGIYLDVREDNGISNKLLRKDRLEQMRKFEKDLQKKLKAPYAVLSMAIEQKYASILMSNDLDLVIDKDEILDDYVIPLLAAKDKNILKSKVSAASLNGYTEIADQIAAYNKIKLTNSIPSDGKTAGTIWRIFMYTIITIGLILYVVIILREKKVMQEKKSIDNE